MVSDDPLRRAIDDSPDQGWPPWAGLKLPVIRRQRTRTPGKRVVEVVDLRGPLAELARKTNADGEADCFRVALSEALTVMGGLTRSLRLSGRTIANAEITAEACASHCHPVDGPDFRRVLLYRTLAISRWEALPPI